MFEKILIIGDDDITVNFEYYLKKGEIGEEKFIQFCHDNNIQVADLRDKKYWQDKDVDFVTKRKERIRLVEVKTDSYMGKTGNFCLEFYQHLADSYWDSELGWAFTSKAELLAIYDTRHNRFYMCELNDLLVFSILYQDDYRKYEKIDRMNSGRTKKRQLLLVSIKDFVEWCEKNNKPLLIKECDNDDNT